MVSNKTGGLLGLGVRLMQAESKTGRNLLGLLEVLGLQFQVCDDCLNLKSATYTHNKGFCEDHRGQVLVSVVRCIHVDTGNKELLSILKQKPHHVEIKKYAVECVKRPVGAKGCRVEGQGNRSSQ